MTLNTDISTALHLLEHVHERVEECDDPKLQMHTSQDLQSLISLLEDPVFRSIVTIQDSLAELNTQLVQHPSILPGDFEINLGGQLQLSVPSTPVQPVGQGMYQNLYQDNSEVDDQRVPVAPLLHSSSEDTSAQVTSPSLNSEVMGMPPIMTPTYAKEFQKVIETAARGRQVFTVQLFKAEGQSLGFSVVGLRSNDRDELGIFLQEIQPNGIAETDGRLVEGDQILAIDGQPLDSNISHEQAISILQKARGLVELIVARSAQDIPTDELSGVTTVASAAAAGAAGGGQQQQQQHTAAAVQDLSSSSNVGASSPDKDQSLSSSAAKSTTVSSAVPAAGAATPSAAQGSVVERSNSAVSETSKSGDMVLNTEWAQVEVINLINDGSGLGFGIIGGRSTGVVVKTILPGGVADRDNRLQSGDHILQIGDVNLRGMGSEQVASVLRQSGTHVRLVVARPVEPTSPDYQSLGSHASIVPTKILGDPEELDRYLLRNGADAYSNQRRDNNGSIFGPDSDLDLLSRPSLIMDAARPSVPISDLPLLSMDPIDVNALPEMERFTVELRKDSCGLGITIAGYVCEKEELSGIFVKSISEGSAADLSGKIQINDRIVEVNGHSLQGYSNHEAVEVLRSTGQIVKLCLERYLRGPKYEQLQQAIAASQLRMPQPGSPSITSLPTFPISADGDTTLEIEPEGESHTTVDSGVLQEIDRDALMGNSEEITNVEALLSDPSTELTPKIEAAIKSKWQKIVGPETEIVVAQLKKFKEGSGLGISLEGTVDVENGQEVRPHHYIRSILPDGPVGQNGILRSGDELLEVNGYRLLDINHMEVVSVLKELPIHVRMVCGRSISSQDPLCPIDTAQHQAAFQTRSILGGSLQNLLPSSDRLVKAKSDGSLASTTTTATVTDASLNKMKSRSLEPLTGLAMWSSEPQIIELVKGERGLGFSILDYQDPMNPNETVIVIRSLVPGGVAQVDGQLIPGDRLLFVNDIALENATLDQAVQALKGAPKGVVRIGVAKPLPIPDSIAQRLTQGGVVRRSKSLPDSDATEQQAAAAADLNDFLSSRSGTSGTAGSDERARAIDALLQPGSAPVTKVHRSTDLGFVELLPRARRKDDEDPLSAQQPHHKPLVKLTPFSEEQRRAKLSQEETDLPVPIVPTVTPTTTPTTSSAAARRRSLREQESLERVAHFLEHQQQEQVLQEDKARLPAESPLKQDEPKDNRLQEETPVAARGDQQQQQQQQQRYLGLSAPVEEQAPAKRRSSLRRRHEDTGFQNPIYDLQDGEERTIVLPIETTKKTVRICSVDEEIRIESFDSAEMDDLMESSSYPEEQEVQLVTAKILTAEELADSIARREDSSKSPSRDEAEAISRLEGQLQLPASLKPSASENALGGGRPDDNKISEKNIKPEILMDLSLACVEKQRPPMKLLTSPKPKRKLSRVRSDSAALQQPQQPTVVKFQLGDDYDDADDEEDRPQALWRSRTDLSTFGLRELCERWKSDEGQPPTSDSRVVAEEPARESDKKWKSASDVPRIQEEAEAADLVPVKRWLSENSALAPSRSRPRQRRSLPSDLRRRGSKLQRQQEQQKPQVAVVHDHRAPVRDALLLKEEPPPPDDEAQDKHSRTDTAAAAAASLSREHSLKYQQQTLESPASLEDLLGATTDASSPPPDFEVDRTLDYSSTQSLLSTSYKSYSPKREVETQTQGEHKHTQYEVEDLVSYVEDVYDSRSGSREQLEFLIEARFGSPRREADTQTELESKGCQCESEELAASGEFGPFFKRQLSFGSPRREVEVQTGQDSRSTQCNFEEFGVEDRGLRWREPLRGDSRRVPDRRVVACGTSSFESSSSPGSQSPQRDIPPAPLIVLLKGGGITKQIDMTVTHRDRDGNVVWEKHWGPERLVEIYREHQTSLGLSIVGGKVDLQDSSSSSKSQNVSGIFIKNVLPNSPAGRAGGLQIGDRIIEVDGVDLRNSTHERAVKAIQAAGNPVRLLVQSLVHLSPDNEDQDRDGAGGFRAGGSSSGGGGGGGGRWQSTRNRTSPPSSRRRSGSPSGSPEVIQDGRSGVKRQDSGGVDSAGPSNRRSSMKKSIRKRAPSPPGGEGQGGLSEEPAKKQPPAPKPVNKYSSGESSGEEEEDTRDLEGNVYTKNGVEIARKSAGNVKRTKAEIAEDPEEEDEFGYTTNKVKKKYHNLKKPVYLVKLDRDRTGLGISLAGHKDRNKMAVYICGLNPNGLAAKNGQLQVGDEILEVNGMVFQGRCHLNASSMIKGMPYTQYKIIVVRRPGAIDSCAVKQVSHFPTALAGEDYSHLKGVHAVPIKKGTYGLGIMIIEGKHGEVGQGIFVSDIQEGSAAEQAGLNVGDMILSVNADSVMGATYDEATALLKKAEGVVTLTVCNPNQKKVAEDEERKARGEKVDEPGKDKKKDEKPKDEPPGDPKDCNIRMNKDTTIEFPKDKNQPIGFTVIGGHDTSLNGVFVLDVFTDGAAGKDGRLKPGDRIVEFNKEVMKAVEQEKAYQMIMRFTQGPVHMIVHRDERAYEEFEVELTKKAGKGSGLVLTGYKSGKGAYVSEVVAGGTAAENGRIIKGDRVVAVGGTDLREAPVEDIALHVKVSNPVQLKLARYRAK